MSRKRLFLGLLLGLAFLASCALYLTMPFIVQQMAFDVDRSDDQTRIKNKHFEFEFLLSDSCVIDSEMITSIIAYRMTYRRGDWMGNLICKKYGATRVSVWNDDETVLTWRGQLETLPDSPWVHFGKIPGESGWYSVIVEDRIGKKVMSLSIHEQNKKMFEEMIQSAKTF